MYVCKLQTSRTHIRANVTVDTSPRLTLRTRRLRLQATSLVPSKHVVISEKSGTAVPTCNSRTPTCNRSHTANTDKKAQEKCCQRSYPARPQPFTHDFVDTRPPVLASRAPASLLLSLTSLRDAENGDGIVTVKLPSGCSVTGSTSNAVPSTCRGRSSSRCCRRGTHFLSGRLRGRRRASRRSGPAVPPGHQGPRTVPSER